MPDETTQQIQEAANLSVQTPNYPYRAASLVNLGYRGEYAQSLPPISDPRRQAFLRAISVHPQNSMWMGAVSGLIKQLISTPYEVKGKRKVAYYQGILLNANEGDGWEAFAQALVWDYLTSDEGACMQLIGRGATDTPLSREMVVGISVLDTYRCWYTGNWEYPVWYQDAITGKLHQLHYTRVVRFVDSPLSDPWYRGAGVSALSRAITYVQQNITQNTYIGESLSDMPPVGMALVHGIVPQIWADAWEKYNAARGQGRNSAYAPIVDLVAMGEKEPKVDFIRFATAPEGFDARQFEEIQAIGIARALNIDPQDVMPISGGSFGTNTQARVLDRKAQGKMLANLYAMLERAFNLRLLPDPLQFNFKPRDTEKTAADAGVTKLHIENAAAMVSMGLSKEIAVRYLAASDPTLQDLLLDENGELVYGYDDDRVEDTPQPIPAEANADGEQTATDINSTAGPDAPTVNSENKAFSAAGFRKRFEPVIERLNGDEISRRSAVNTLRPILYNEGLQAFISGLADNGVTVVNRLSKTDQREYDAWVSETRKYVDDMVRTFYGDDALRLTPDGVRNKVEMWVNKSLRDAYYRGLTSGARDPNMLWEYGATEHCKDCQNYNGQVHRLSTWKETAMPGSSRLECAGYNCKCRITKTQRRANPNPPNRPTNAGAKHVHKHTQEVVYA